MIAIFLSGINNLSLTRTDSEDGKIYIDVEEAVFLVDQGALELYHNGLPLSLNQAIQLLAICGFGWDRYHV